MMAAMISRELVAVAVAVVANTKSILENKKRSFAFLGCLLSLDEI